MTTIEATIAKCEFKFKDGGLKIAPEDPRFLISIGGVYVSGKISAKSARKLAAHQGGCSLVGRLTWQDNQLQLLEAGVVFHVKPAEAAAPTDGVTTTPRG